MGVLAPTARPPGSEILKDLLMPAWGIPISPGTDPPHSSKAKQSMAVIVGITHCQHKYTDWTIQPFTAGKSQTVDDSQSAFFFPTTATLFL